MIPSIEKRIDKLDDSLNELLGAMDARPENQNNKPEGAWSPLQVLYHLYISETGTARYLNKKILAEDVPTSGIKSAIATRLLQRALRNNKKKYRAPKGVGDVPDEPNFDKLKSDYFKARKELRDVLGRFDEKMSKKAYFKHPRAGRMNIHQTLSFLEDHFERHKNQIYERLK